MTDDAQPPMTEEKFRERYPPPPAPPGPDPIPTKTQTLAPIKEATIENSMGKRFTISEVEATLLRYDGNSRLAATHLVMIPQKLKGFMRAHAELEKWIPVRMKGPDGKTITIIPALKAREEILKIAGPGDSEIMSVPANLKTEELLEQVEKENKAIKEGLITLGASAAKAEEMLNVGKNFQLRHFDQAASFASLGVAVNFTNQLDVLRSIEKRLKEPDGLRYNEKGDPVEESMLLEAYCAISEESRRTAEFWMKSQLTLARIQQIKKAESVEKPKSAKAAFRPKGAILVTSEVAG